MQEGEKPQPVQQSTIVVESYENQRWYPVCGWRGRLLPTDRYHYSDVTGKKECRRDKWPLPSGYVWQTEWTVRVEEGKTDKDGWLYALDFPASNWARSQSKGDFVRRRLWMRTMCLADPNHPQIATVVDERSVDMCGSESEDSPTMVPPQNPTENQKAAKDVDSDGEPVNEYRLPPEFVAGGRVRPSDGTAEAEGSNADYNALLQAFLAKDKQEKP